MSNKGRKFPAEILTRVEIMAMIARFGASPTGKRNQALLIALWRAGLRCSEALALHLRDVDQVERRLRVREGKGGVARTSPIDPPAMAVIQVWMAVRQKLGLRSQVLFCTLKGEPLETRYVRSMVARVAKGSGIRKRVHPHAFRHTFAVELMREGQSVALISKALGHASIAVTARYLSHLEDGELCEVIDNRPSWRDEDD